MKLSDDDALLQQMKALAIQEEELVEKFILASGPGGQKIQKSSSSVYLKHLPTGIEVKCQDSRSREENRRLARWKLCAQIEGLRRKKEEEKRRQRHIARQKRRGRSKETKRRLVEEKRRRSAKKEQRRAPKEYED